MRWWLLVASVSMMVVVTIPEAWAGGRPLRPDGESHRGKRKRERTGHGRSRGGPRPLKIRLVPGPNIPMEPMEKLRHSGSVNKRNIQEQQLIYRVIPGKLRPFGYQGLTTFYHAVWGQNPCVTCQSTGEQVVRADTTYPIMRCRLSVKHAGECCPSCMESDSRLSLELSGDSLVPNDPNEATTLLTQEEIQRIVWWEEEEHREEEEQLMKKEEARKKRRRERKEKEERQKMIAQEGRRQEEEALRLQIEKEEEEWRREVKEREDKRMQEEKMRIEDDERREREREKQEKERKLEEERISEQEAKEKEEVWLRGDVFEMPPKELDLPSTSLPKPPSTDHKRREAETEDEEEEEVRLVESRGGLPPGCDISDVTVTCENAKLTYFPPLSIPELKSISLEGNNISSIPAQAFNGIPNLEWINLRKNKLTSAGIDAEAFKGLKMLRRLYLDENLLESVPSDLPPTLQELKINENRLRVIDETSFQGMSSLVILELEGNLLSEGNVDPLAFSPLSQLSYLRLGKNYFRTVPLGLPKSLLELYLENNLIEDISVSVFNQTTNLNAVSLGHNKLDETRIAPMAWINHRNLESIDLSHNEFYLVPSFLPTSLVHLVLVGNKIERIPGYVFAHMNPGLEYLYLSYNKLDGEGTEPESFFGTYQSMVEMCLDHNQLINVPAGINEMKALHFLRLDNNMIRSIPEDSICDPDSNGDNTLVALRLENNFINSNQISPTAFSCIRAASSVVLKPQKVKN